MHFPTKDGDSFSSERDRAGHRAAPLHENQQSQLQSVRTIPTRDQQLRLQRTIELVLNLLDLDDFEGSNSNNNGRPIVSNNAENQPNKPPGQNSPSQ
jgi:hypothetical protein